MKRLINGLQWAGFLGAVVFIAWLVLRPSPPLVYAPDTWSNWEGFMTLSYAGVSRSDSSAYPSSETLISHLEALKQVGYKTIRPEDALAFLEGRAPLPDKALLILFEGARKETFIRAHPVLRRLGMQATLCVPTESIENWDESRLKKRDVRKIALMPQWSIASMGNEAVNPIEVSATGGTDHFLSMRKWLKQAKRVEDDGEFSKRIAADYKQSADLLGTLNGYPVAAYVYPFADEGRRVGADPLAARFNQANVTSYYRMAFVSASNPYNPPGRDAYSLSRLRVSGDWSAAQVLTRLQHARPLAAPVSGTEDKEHWSFLNGARVVDDGLRLNSDDAAWIKGSDLWTDAVISAVLTRSPGTTAALYARFITPSHCLRLTMDEKTMRLQESRGGGTTTLAACPAPAGDAVRLVWRVKGLRAWVTANGLPMLGPVPLAPPQPSGVIGFECSQGRVVISSLAVKPITRLGLAAESWGNIPDDIRYPVTEFFPTFSPDGRELSAQQGFDLIQAVTEGATVWPMITETNGGLSEARIEAMTAMLTAKDLKPFVKGFVLGASQSQWASSLRRQGFSVMHRVRAGEPVPLPATNQVDYVWLDEAGSNGVAAAQAFLHRHPPAQLMVRDDTVMNRFPGVGRVMERESRGGK